MQPTGLFLSKPICLSFVYLITPAGSFKKPRVFLLNVHSLTVFLPPSALRRIVFPRRDQWQVIGVVRSNEVSALQKLDAGLSLLLLVQGVQRVQHVYAHAGEGDDGEPDDDGRDEALLEALRDCRGLVRPGERLVGYRLVEEFAQRLPAILQVHFE